MPREHPVVLKTIVVTAAVSAGVAGTAAVVDELSAQRHGSPAAHGIVVEVARVLDDVGFGRLSQGAMRGPIRSD